MRTVYLPLAVTMFLFFVSCKKDRKEDQPTPNNPSITINIPAIGGHITDENGNPLSGVTVQFGNYITTSDYNGEFIIENLTTQLSRAVIKFSKQGYFEVYRTVTIENGKSVILDVSMISENSSMATTKIFYANTSDSVMLNDGSRISFPANAFIKSDGTPYNGLVTVKVCYLDPTSENYSKLTYGGDNIGITLNNNVVYLTPIKGLIISIKDDNGEPLQLDTLNNKKATIRFAIPSDLLANAPNTAPVWFYATNNGTKMQRGDANKEGNAYVCQVGHFSYWSCEIASNTKAIITGKVFKTISGTEYRGGGMPIEVGNMLVYTDENGVYKAIVPSGLNIAVRLKYPGSSIYYLVTTQADQTHTVNFDLTNWTYVFSATVKKNTGTIVSSASISMLMYAQGNNYHILNYTNSQGTFSVFKPIDLQVDNLSLDIKSGKSKRYISLNGSTITSDMIGAIIWLPGRTYFKKSSYTLFDSDINELSTHSYLYQQEINFSFYTQSPSGGYQSVYFSTPTNISEGSTINGVQVTYYDGQTEKILTGDLKITKFINSPYGLIEGYFINLKDDQNISYELNFSAAFSYEI